MEMFRARLEALHGKADRIWIMDRGMPTEAHLAEMRASDPPVRYLVGTPRPRVKATRAQGENLPWQKVQGTVEVKLFRADNELYVVAKSDGRRQKELAIRRKKRARFLWTLRGLRREQSRDRRLQRLGAARQALDALAGVQMLDVVMPTTDGRQLTLSQHTQPETSVRLLLQQLKLALPEQPPPRLGAARKLEPLPSGCSEDLSGAATQK
jgi:hypothetical protein